MKIEIDWFDEPSIRGKVIKTSTHDFTDAEGAQIVKSWQIGQRMEEGFADWRFFELDEVFKTVFGVYSIDYLDPDKNIFDAPYPMDLRVDGKTMDVPEEDEEDDDDFE